jgi:hypothetical protein
LDTWLFHDAFDVDDIDIVLSAEGELSWFQDFNSALGTGNAANFTVVHLNINSVVSKLCHIEKLLLANLIDILVLQESKIGDSVPNKLHDFPNYNVIRRDRLKGGGGILFYHRDSYTITKIRIHPKSETIIFSPQSDGKTLSFVVSYKPPSTNSMVYLQHIDDELACLKLIDHVFLVGDLNMDLNSFHGRPLADVMETYGFRNTILEPTRINNANHNGSIKVRESILDVCFTNNPESILKADVADCRFSDHKFIFAILHRKSSRSKNCTITTHKLTENVFRFDMVNFPFSILENFEDLNEKWCVMK